MKDIISDEADMCMGSRIIRQYQQRQVHPYYHQKISTAEDWRLEPARVGAKVRGGRCSSGTLCDSASAYIVICHQIEVEVDIQAE
jgi:hypothetical protein